MGRSSNQKEQQIEKHKIVCHIVQQELKIGWEFSMMRKLEKETKAPLLSEALRVKDY